MSNLFSPICVVERTIFIVDIGLVVGRIIFIKCVRVYM
jgi:hypothetical protein